MDHPVAFEVKSLRNDGRCICFFKERRKAISYAFRYYPDFWDDKYTDLRVKRKKKLDKYYRGVSMMEWENQEDRLAMVKELNYCCTYSIPIEKLDCANCSAKSCCSRSPYRTETVQFEEDDEPDDN